MIESINNFVSKVVGTFTGPVETKAPTAPAAPKRSVKSVKAKKSKKSRK